MQQVYAYSDNILEGVRFAENLDAHSSLLDLTDESFDDPSQPRYTFSSSEGDTIELIVRGQYDHWTLPESVENAVTYIGRPDIVLVDSTGDPILGGEFTDAAPIGNMIYQREGRQVGLLQAGFPTVYDTAYTATDRTKTPPAPRFPPATIVLLRLAYCQKFGLPAFLCFYKDETGEARAKEKYEGYPPTRDYDTGTKYLHEYLSAQLLDAVYGTYSGTVEDAQRDILRHMIEYLQDTPVVRSSASSRLEKDVPALANQALINGQQEEFIDHLIEVINGREEPDPAYDITDMAPDRLVEWTGGHHKRKPLNATVLNSSLSPKTVGSGQNPYIVADTPALIDAVSSRYPPLTGALRELNSDLETVVITMKFFQKKRSNCLVKVDPYSGAIAAFGEWLSRDITNEKIRNVLVYSHSGCAVTDLEVNNKLHRSLEETADVVIVSVGDDNNADQWHLM
ncbi:hypothetical protein ACFOZ7_15440 [Natribaculum luteum]|uniref:Uncharacterized protein n=1 Tax=Natribaculum luteum TaxID=1586232 RepID=A0ABD5P1Y9_9EURY|nr:hypothetical protein [Natribaculum luteum]